MIHLPAFPWSVEPHTTADKRFALLDRNGEPVLWFDYDDVDHEQVDATARHICQELNKC